MSPRTTQQVTNDREYHPWIAAVIAGLLAGTGMGIILSLGTGIMPLIGVVFGLGTFLGGWIVHLASSILAALIFAVILSRSVIRDEISSLETYVGIGIGYGALQGLLISGILWPLWYETGAQAGLRLPFMASSIADTVVFGILIGVSVLVYGAILGLAYAILSRSIPVDRFNAT